MTRGGRKASVWSDGGGRGGGGARDVCLVVLSSGWEVWRHWRLKVVGDMTENVVDVLTVKSAMLV